MSGSTTNQSNRIIVFAISTGIFDDQTDVTLGIPHFETSGAAGHNLEATLRVAEDTAELGAVALCCGDLWSRSCERHDHDMKWISYHDYYLLINYLLLINNHISLFIDLFTY
jgi:hypothetical protein